MTTDKGDTGATGATGATGIQGEQGNQGNRGATGKQGASPIHELRKLFAILGLLVVAFFSVLLLSQHNSVIKGCERNKVTNSSLAKGANAQVTYLDKVLAAQSVKADVKEAATQARERWSASATRLNTVAHIDCSKVYPLLG